MNEMKWSLFGQIQNATWLRPAELLYFFLPQLLCKPIRTCLEVFFDAFKCLTWVGLHREGSNGMLV